MITVHCTLDAWMTRGPDLFNAGCGRLVLDDPPVESRRVVGDGRGPGRLKFGVARSAVHPGVWDYLSPGTDQADDDHFVVCGSKAAAIEMVTLAAFAWAARAAQAARPPERPGERVLRDALAAAVRT